MNRLAAAAFALSLAFSAPLPANAQLPDSVKTAYKDYVAAKAAGEGRALSDAAYAAWQAAEDALGDHRTTGDLASNYALTTAPATGQTYDARVEAYERAVALASLYETGAEEIEVQRRIFFVQYLLDYADLPLNRSTFFYQRAKTELKRLGALIDQAGLGDTTYAAEHEALWAQYWLVLDKPRMALTSADEALAAFDGAARRTTSVYPLRVRFIKAQALARQGQTVDALLVYQDARDLAQEAGLDDKSVAVTSVAAQKLEAEAMADGSMEEAKARGYRPLSGSEFGTQTNDVEPLVRIPPRMPRKARRSGWVKLRFDVGTDGRPVNVEAFDYSEKVFIEPATESVLQWFYATGDRAGPREDVETTVSFRLTNTRGKLLPPKKPFPTALP